MRAGTASGACGSSIQSFLTVATSRNCLRNSVGLPPWSEDLSAFGNCFHCCGTRSLHLSSFTNYVFSFVSVELIPGRPVGVVEGRIARLVYTFEF